MDSKLILLVILGVACVQGFSPKHGRVSKLIPVPPGHRVVEGWPAANGDYPHMAYLSMGCGGSLVSDSWVMTAAHCVDGYTPSSLSVSLGDVVISASPVRVGVERIEINPGWNPNNLNNDIALLKLTTPVSFTDTIKPIAIASNPSDLFVGEVATLSGFGYTGDDFVFPASLQYVDLKIITNDECAEYFGIFIVPSTICGNGIQTPAQGSCFGDSGSGLILRRSSGNIIIGVTSFIGWQGCEGHSPSGFVRTNHYLPWIREITGINV